MSKTVHLVLFGAGRLSSRIIKQLQSAEKQLAQDQQLIIKLPVIADKDIALVHQNGAKDSWKSDLNPFKMTYGISEISSFLHRQHFDNLIAIDATDDNCFLRNYCQLFENGFHLISANAHLSSISAQDQENLSTAAFVYNKQVIKAHLTAEATQTAQQHKVNRSKSTVKNDLDQQFIQELIQLTTHLN